MLGRAFERVREALARAQAWTGATLRRMRNRLLGTTIKLSYFDEVLAVEHEAVNRRRARTSNGASTRRKRGPVEPLAPDPSLSADDHVPPAASSSLPPPRRKPLASGDPRHPDLHRMRPRPIPCDTIGLALSGGGIRSAAFSLGALQALDSHRVVDQVDYLSTVSGGGYIGASMSAGMSRTGGEFPFGSAADVRDNDAIGHIRNYSNYLMPRARSTLRNALDVASILLRGLAANAILVLTFLLIAALLTWFAYPTWGSLLQGSFMPRLISAAMPAAVGAGLWHLAEATGAAAWLDLIASAAARPFALTCLLMAALAVALVLWALQRSTEDNDANDADSWSLTVARWLLGFTVVSAILDLQPLLLCWLADVYVKRIVIPAVLGPAVVAAVVMALFARRLGAFLETTQLSASDFVRALRIFTSGSLIVAGLVLPLTLLVVYLHLSAWIIAGSPIPDPLPDWTSRPVYCGALVALVPIILLFQANAYSLHQFYKDRLSAAFLFDPQHFSGPEPRPLEKFKLSDMQPDHCPYLIVNAALNVQGSREANRRGRDADFFTFTRDFIGSDLTLFARTRSTASTADMERVDPRLDLGSAMAISGAAVSANMGSNTVRWLSPTLALLNIRLGYWLRNPRHLAKLKRRMVRPLRDLFFRTLEQFYLLVEMLNFLDEESRFIYLTDGGHIENLGVYALLKRGCKLVIAIDAEADPAVSCPSLLKLERYARIDLGVRIILPWEQIAAASLATDRAIDPRSDERAPRRHGPHCAIGRILFDNEAVGILLYFKSSLSGDEKDYMLDYKKRNRSFPHETTGDQFFTEEQFEVYRALGFHVVEGFFSDTDEFSWLSEGRGAWDNAQDAKADVRRALLMT